MNKDSQDVLKLLELGFPKPVPGSEADYEIETLLSQSMASDAVNEFDHQFRVDMLFAVALKLIDGSKLLVPERAWLLYVLKKISAEKLPHEHKGRAPISRMDSLVLKCKLGRAMFEQEQSNPNSTVTGRLKSASVTLGKSYESLRAIYYSKSYKAVSSKPFFNRICRENRVVD